MIATYPSRVRRGLAFAMQLVGVVILAIALAAGTLYVVWASSDTPGMAGASQSSQTVDGP